ncbi:uncharacterized protein LOC114346260 [Diabrotica virgifera virgifera]|uniref:Uncharacterized protein LOC114346260 n=1 Tax=Diabrotica virgifera virgifera TaxID=50390 RepID=A0A6P7H575_DIAVI|nr:uncharacterized protein LOC114346260 [Diabrotica virgifera virgifera]
MSRKMQINRLDKDELSYEVAIRVIAVGTVDEMRQRLARAIQLEKEGDSLNYPKYPFSFAEDLEYEEKKLKEIESMISDLTEAKLGTEAVKIQTKLSHVLGRIENMDSEVAEEMTKKSELVAVVLSSMDTFAVKRDALKSKPAQPPALSLVQAQIIQVNTFFQQGIANVPVSSSVVNLAQLGPSHSTARRILSSNMKSIPPYKWNLQKFTGDSRGMSINAFFEQVEELRQARNVTEQDMLDSGIDLFSGKANYFYKYCRERVTSWSELVSEFRTEYLSSSHTDDLFEEIRKRTQYSSESIGVYLAILLSYFGRLGCVASEEVKLSIILRNLHPFYQERLREPLHTFVAKLRSVCRNMEDRRDLINSYVEPTSSRRRNLIERDLDYVDVNLISSTDQEKSRFSSSTSSLAENRKDSPRTKEIVCFKCNQPGHKAIGCVAMTKKKCFKCNKEGFTVRTYPNCNRNQGNEQRRH